MDAGDWGTTQPEQPPMDGGDWKAQLPSESRQRIVNKIMDTLKRHLPCSGQDGWSELKNIAVRFEEKIYTDATNQCDYLRKISLKMLTMETKARNTMANSIASNPSTSSKSSSDQASLGIQSQVPNQGQSIPMPLGSNQSQARQSLLTQSMQNNIVSSGVTISTGMQSSQPPVSGLNQTAMPNVVGQNTNMQTASGVSQASVGNSMGQGVSSNMFVNSQRQMQGRQQIISQQHAQNSQQFLYQQHLQQQLLKQKLQQGNVSHTLMQSHIQQQQQTQQNILPPTQLQSSQQSVLQTSSSMQPSLMQSALVSGNQPNQSSSVQQSTQSMLQQHPQTTLRQQQQPQPASLMHKQQGQMAHPPLLPSQPQQQLIGQQPNASNMQQNQLIGQQNSVTDMQQQRFLGQQNNLMNLQQQQQLMSQQSNLSNMHLQQLNSQSNASGPQQQQQQLLGTQSSNSNMQTNQHSLHMLQQPKMPVQQQIHQGTSTILSTQGQQSQTQHAQQQLMSQVQSQSGQLQQQLGMQQHPNSMPRDIQQRPQMPGTMLQPQNVMDQQKQLLQAQRSMLDAPPSSVDSSQTGQANGIDWQEEVYQKIKSMKEMYLLELNEMYQKIAPKIQQHESLHQQPRPEQLDKLKLFKNMLERSIQFLQVPKNNVTLALREKLNAYEKQIIGLLNSSRVRKPNQTGQLPQNLPLMQQPLQAQSQITQAQPLENQMNSQLHTMSLQGSLATRQQSGMGKLEHGSLSTVSGASNPQPNMINSLQLGSSLDPGQGSSLGLLQQVAVGSLQQNPASAPQQANLCALSSQNVLQPNMSSLQSSSNMLQNQHMKQHQDHQALQTPQLKQQLQQRQMQQQLMQKQQLLQQQQQQQQLHQQTKQQQSAQLLAHQMSHLHQSNDVSDLKMRSGMGVKSGIFQQHHMASQRSAYNQQLKPGSSFPISSPQFNPAASPQIPQHSSPQIDQQNQLQSLTKTGTSPFIVPSPSSPLAPSPIPGDAEKHNSAISSVSNAANIVGHQQTNVIVAPTQSLAIGTPGISASPLLAEFTTTDANHGNALTVASGKTNVMEQPLERLIKAVKSVSPEALRSSVSDIDSVVSMIDRIAGSAPGNGSKAAVGEDLVSMTKCVSQAKSFMMQDGSSGVKKMRRYISAMPLVVSSAGSVNDSFKQLTGSEISDLESTATSSIKRQRIEVNHTLLEEIREINQRLIDTVVDVSDEEIDPTAAAEGGEGTVVKCSFNAVALSPNLKSQYSSVHMSPIHPLRVLVPSNYPKCSPILLDKFPVEIREYEDLSVKARSRFNIFLRNLCEPMLLGDIAQTWDACARTVISDYAQERGGGCFSSRYGAWENCLRAS